MASDFYPGFYNRVSAKWTSVLEWRDSCFFFRSIAVGYEEFWIQSIKNETQYGDTIKFL